MVGARLVVVVVVDAPWSAAANVGSVPAVAVPLAAETEDVHVRADQQRPAPATTAATTVKMRKRLCTTKAFLETTGEPKFTGRSAAKSATGRQTG